jgi:uncharacterized membrane protein
MKDRLKKVIAWRCLSITITFLTIFFVTGNIEESSTLTLFLHVLLVCFHFVFEYWWDYRLERRKTMNRKTRRAMKKGKLKKLNDAAAKVENAVASMPKKCEKCNKDFKMTDKSQLDDWYIEVYADGSIKLNCPDCSKNSNQ